MRILSSIEENKDIINKEYINNLDNVLDFEIVNTLPTGANINEDIVYLIQDGETGGGIITYTLSKSGNSIILTGSNGNTSTVTDVGLSSAEVQAMIDSAIGDVLEDDF